ncbi:MAG TPA: GIY-YIG nuclease family protein [Anaeromyxobacteraceae bacterium]|nr:GIY-YIG nuclease family protein [Anaeromyxobacteraceae bacterium]
MAARPVAEVAGWVVYLLRCADGSLYAGATNDLPRRLARHASGQGSRYTRARLPVRVVFREPAPDRGAALRREAALKRLSRAEKLALVSSALRRRPRRGAGAGRRASPRPRRRSPRRPR